MRVTSGELGHKIAGQSLTWDWEAYFTGTFWEPIYPIFGSEQDKPCAKPQTLICRFYRRSYNATFCSHCSPKKSALGGSGFGCKFLGTPKPNLSLYGLYYKQRSTWLIWSDTRSFEVCGAGLILENILGCSYLEES